MPGPDRRKVAKVRAMNSLVSLGGEQGLPSRNPPTWGVRRVRLINHRALVVRASTADSREAGPAVQHHRTGSKVLPGSRPAAGEEDRAGARTASSASCSRGKAAPAEPPNRPSPAPAPSPGRQTRAGSRPASGRRPKPGRRPGNNPFGAPAPRPGNNPIRLAGGAPGNNPLPSGAHGPGRPVACPVPAPQPGDAPRPRPAPRRTGWSGTSGRSGGRRPASVVARWSPGGPGGWWPSRPAAQADLVVPAVLPSWRSAGLLGRPGGPGVVLVGSRWSSGGGPGGGFGGRPGGGPGHPAAVVGGGKSLGPQEQAREASRVRQHGGPHDRWRCPATVTKVRLPRGP